MKLLLLLTLLLPALSLANITARQEHLINTGAKNSVVQLGTLLNKTKNLVRVTYDYAVDGGAVGDIIPRKGATIPDNAIITRVWAEGITQLTSSGFPSSFHAHVQTDQDLLGALEVHHFTAGWLGDGVPIATASTMKKMSADRKVVFVASTNAITAGKLDLYVEYVLGN